MTETSHYMIPTSRPQADLSLDYRFVDNNVEAVEEANPYENMVFSKPADSNTTHQAEPAPSHFPKQSIEPREDNFKFRWILIMAAVAFLINLGGTACGLWLAIQGNSRITQVQNNMNDELNAEVEKRKIAVEALKYETVALAEQINERAENQRDFLIQRQDDFKNSTDSSFAEFQQKTDLFSKIFGFLFHHKTNLTEVLDLVRREDVLSQVTDILIQHHDNLTKMTAEFSKSQNKMDLFSKVFRFLVHHQTNLTELLEAMRTGDLVFQVLGIRLVGGTSNSGRVEVYHNGEWGTICDDVRDADAGNMMCRLLGFNTATTMQCCAAYGRGSGQIWLDDLRCLGTETTLGNCSHLGWGVHNCGHGEDLSITCS